MSHAYEKDVFAWATEQAALLRSGRLSELDIDHIAEEIESVGSSQKRELVSRLTVLLQHLLKWQFQAALRGKSLQVTIRVQRRDLAYLMKNNPSLRSMLSEAIAQAYGTAVIKAGAETDIAESVFPSDCPWTFEQMMDPDFWPGEAAS
jgi:ribosomal protein L29